MLATFWGMEHIIGSVTHYGLRSALRDQQILYTRMQVQNDEQNRRYLRTKKDKLGHKLDWGPADDAGG